MWYTCRTKEASATVNPKNHRGEPSIPALEQKWQPTGPGHQVFVIHAPPTGAEPRVISGGVLDGRFVFFMPKASFFAPHSVVPLGITASTGLSASSCLAPSSLPPPPLSLILLVVALSSKLPLLPQFRGCLFKKAPTAPR